IVCLFFFFSSRRRHTRSKRDWSSDVCSSDLFIYFFVRFRLYFLGFVFSSVHLFISFGLYFFCFVSYFILHVFCVSFWIFFCFRIFFLSFRLNILHFCSCFLLHVLCIAFRIFFRFRILFFYSIFIVCKFFCSVCNTEYRTDSEY